MGRHLTQVTQVVEHRERRGGQRVARGATGDDGVRPGWSDTADGFPSDSELTQLPDAEPRLQPRKQGVLLVADVLAEYFNESGEDFAALGGREIVAVEAHRQLVDLLVLLLDLKGEGFPVGQHSPDHRPQHGLLGERVRKHQSVDPD
jgi:hypothetical protein